jgi:FecR protein
MPIAGRLALLLLSTQTMTVCAQYVVSASAGTIHFVTGEVFVDGKPVDWTPVRFPLLAQAQVLTTGNGRAEILLGAGVFMRVEKHSAVRMLNNSLEDAQVEIQQGNALVEVVGIPKGSDVHVVLGLTRTGFRGIGLHRLGVMFYYDQRTTTVTGNDAAPVIPNP